MEADAVMVIGMEAVAACGAAAIGTTGVINAANEVAAEAAVGYTTAQYDVSAGLVWRQMQGGYDQMSTNGQKRIVMNHHVSSENH